MILEQIRESQCLLKIQAKLPLPLKRKEKWGGEGEERTNKRLRWQPYQPRVSALPQGTCFFFL